jgi:hypothetical protein
VNNAVQDELLTRFIATFGILDEMRASQDLSPIAWQLAAGPADDYGEKIWRPLRRDTEPELLERVYAKLPARFPPLYERLLLTYRWDMVDLEFLRLLPNPPGEDFSELLPKEKDFLANFLIKAGYIRFGLGPDIDFDPICFELRSRKKSREFRVVKIDHEDILCREKLTIVSEVAPTFRDLVLKVIELADRKPTKLRS